MSMVLFHHRGYALKQRAIRHIISTMWSIPHCMPNALGEGPKKIGHRAGFNFHSEFRRQYARGLILEAVDAGYVEPVPMGATRNRYRLTIGPNQESTCFVPYLDPGYVVALEHEGACIMKDAKALVCEYLRWTGLEWHRSNSIERAIGFHEPHTDEHTHAGYWGWLVIEELINDGILERQQPGRDIMVRFKK